MADITLEMLRDRHSVRAYTSQPLENGIINSLEAEISFINTHAIGMHFQLFTEDTVPFDGIRRSYGLFSGVRNYIACVADTSYSNWQQRLGFHSMQILMHAYSVGIGTCFVGATFDRKYIQARVRVGQEMPIVIALGYEKIKENTFQSIARKIIKKQKIGAENLIEDPKMLSDIPKTLYPGLEAIALSPSARDIHPYKIRYSENKLQLLSIGKGRFLNIDMGIAAYSFSAVCRGEWNWGETPTWSSDGIM